MKKIIPLLILIISQSYLNFAQSDIEWQKSIGGMNTDVAYTIQPTADGGFIFSGFSDSNDGDISNNRGDRDYLVIKTNNIGDIQWQRSLGGSGKEEAYYVSQTNDNGFIISGYSISNDSDVTGNHGNYDYWIVKIDSAGTIEKQKSLGGTGIERAYSIHQTIDGGYIVAGYSNSTDGDITFYHDFQDYWILKLDTSFTIEWQRSLGGTFTDEAFSIQQTTDSGYIVAGYANSTNGNVNGHLGLQDYWIIKLNNAGTVEWSKCLGGNDSDEANDVKQTMDGGYVIAGYSESVDVDVTGNHGGRDFWIVKLDATGTIEWQKSLGGSADEVANSIIQTTDGGYVVAGYSNSNDGDVTGNHGDYDYWILKLTNAGVLQWQESFGGAGIEGASSIGQAGDGGFIVAGNSYSNDGDVSGHHGPTTSSDCWIVKLNLSVNTNEISNSSFDFQVSPNPFSDQVNFSFNLLKSDFIKIIICDIQGRVVKNINTENLYSGNNRIVWDGSDNSGNKVSDGIYFVRIYSDNFNESKKIIVFKNKL